MRLAVLIPCHNEAAVIVRKLRNLAAAEFPGSNEPQLVVAFRQRNEVVGPLLGELAAEAVFVGVVGVELDLDAGERFDAFRRDVGGAAHVLDQRQHALTDVFCSGWGLGMMHWGNLSGEIGEDGPGLMRTVRIAKPYAATAMG